MIYKTGFKNPPFFISPNLEWERSEMQWFSLSLMLFCVVVVNCGKGILGIIYHWILLGGLLGHSVQRQSRPFSKNAAVRLRRRRRRRWRICSAEVARGLGFRSTAISASAHLTTDFSFITIVSCNLSSTIELSRRRWAAHLRLYLFVWLLIWLLVGRDFGFLFCCLIFCLVH